MVVPATAQDQLAIGRQLYADRCAACHGANLEGQPDWMKRKPDGRLPAPPHDATGHTWHHSDDQLFQIVRDGLSAIVPGYETDMPAFAGVMTDDEIVAVLDYIKSTWPERQQALQKKRSDSDAN
jgi:mono/diheme cytochrome c family protein